MVGYMTRYSLDHFEGLEDAGNLEDAQDLILKIKFKNQNLILKLSRMRRTLTTRSTLAPRPTPTVAPCASVASEQSCDHWEPAIGLVRGANGQKVQDMNGGFRVSC
jgi:hypothetical protein